VKEPREFWNKLAPRYAKSPIRDEQTFQKKLEITQTFFKPDWSVLEFGCGTGSTAIIHAPHVQHILATDISDKMLAIAEQKTNDAGIDNISYRQGTLDSLALEPASFDAVLGLNILHLLPDLDAVVARVHEVLKPGGIFVSSTALIGEISLLWRMLIPAMQLLGFAPYVNRFGKQELATQLTDAGFSIDREWEPAKGSVFIVARKKT
jgi:ubiquinone/menaquinone biosynthesis C-methylase UbiE